MHQTRRLGRYAVMTQLVFAGVLAGFASLHPEPGFVSRGTVLFAIFALPGVVGWIGVRYRRPALVGAAAVTSGLGAFIAFSGVTLIFLVPALMFLASATWLMFPARGEAGGGLVSGASQLVLAAAICGLVVGAGASALLITDSACWIVRRAAVGSTVETLPYSTGEMTLAGDATSGGCSTGNTSVRGVALGFVLAGAALGLSALAARRRVAQVVGPPGPVAAG